MRAHADAMTQYICIMQTHASDGANRMGPASNRSRACNAILMLDRFIFMDSWDRLTAAGTRTYTNKQRFLKKNSARGGSRNSTQIIPG